MSSRGMNSRTRGVEKARFGKHPHCPTSEELVCYSQNSSCVGRTRRAEIDRHLVACDFCGAEIRLLADHPPHKSSVVNRTPAQMPVHLYALARALFSRTPTTTQLIEALHAPTGLTLTDA